MRTYEYLVLHHSLTADNTVLDDSNAIRRYHREVNGWDDIGYHYVVERVAGMLTTSVGRPLSKTGAHCRESGMNERSIGICVVGNFDVAPPDLETVIYVARLCQAFMVNYGIPAQKVIGHRDAGMMDGYDWTKFGPTGVRQFKTCPGVLWSESLFNMMISGKQPI